MPRLTLANKNYSLRSPRAWLAMTEAGIPFVERLVKFDSPDRAANIAALSRTWLAPASREGDPGAGFVTFDTLAIPERLREPRRGSSAAAASGSWLEARRPLRALFRSRRRLPAFHGLNDESSSVDPEERAERRRQLRHAQPAAADRAAFASRPLCSTKPLWTAVAIFLHENERQGVPTPFSPTNNS